MDSTSFSFDKLDLFWASIQNNGHHTDGVSLKPHVLAYGSFPDEATVKAILANQSGIPMYWRGYQKIPIWSMATDKAVTCLIQKPDNKWETKEIMLTETFDGSTPALVVFKPPKAK